MSQKFPTVAGSVTNIGDGEETTNISEGMPRGDVSNAMRVIVAEIGKSSRDQGSLVSGGTSTALTLATYAEYSELITGLNLEFKAHTNLGRDATINVNGLGARPMRANSAGGISILREGMFSEGSMVQMTYDGEAWLIKNAPGAWFYDNAQSGNFTVIAKSGAARVGAASGQGRYSIVGNMVYIDIDFEIGGLGSIASTDPVYLEVVPSAGSTFTLDPQKVTRMFSTVFRSDRSLPGAFAEIDTDGEIRIFWMSGTDQVRANAGNLNGSTINIQGVYPVDFVFDDAVGSISSRVPVKMPQPSMSYSAAASDVVTASFVPPSSPAPITGYTVEYTTDGVRWIAVIGDDSPIDLPKPPAGLTQTVRMFARNSNGSGPPSDALILQPPIISIEQNDLGTDVVAYDITTNLPGTYIARLRAPDNTVLATENGSVTDTAFVAFNLPTAGADYNVIVEVTTTTGNARSVVDAFTALGDASAAPTPSPDTAITAFETPVTIDVLANDTDPESDTLTIESFTQGANGTVTLVAGDLVYTPDTGFDGADSFTYDVSDGTTTVTETVSITVNAAASSLETIRLGALTPSTAGPIYVDGVSDGTYGAFTVTGGEMLWGALPASGTLTEVPGYEVEIVPAVATMVHIDDVDASRFWGAKVMTNEVEIAKSFTGIPPVSALTDISVSPPAGVTINATDKTLTITGSAAGWIEDALIDDLFIINNSGSGFLGIRRTRIRLSSAMRDLKPSGVQGAITTQGECFPLEDVSIEYEEAIGMPDPVLWAHPNTGSFPSLTRVCIPKAAGDTLKLQAPVGVELRLDKCFFGSGGLLGPNFLGTWDSTATYNTDDVVENTTDPGQPTSKFAWEATSDGVTSRPPVITGGTPVTDPSTTANPDWRPRDPHADTGQSNLMRGTFYATDCLFENDEFVTLENRLTNVQAARGQVNIFRLVYSTSSGVEIYGNFRVERCALLQEPGNSHAVIRMVASGSVLARMAGETPPIPPESAFTPAELIDCLISEEVPDISGGGQRNYIDAEHEEYVGRFRGNVNANDGVAIPDAPIFTTGAADGGTFGDVTEVTDGHRVTKNSTSGSTYLSYDLGVLDAGTYTYTATSLTNDDRSLRMRASPDIDLTAIVSNKNITAVNGVAQTDSITFTLASVAQTYVGMRIIGGSTSLPTTLDLTSQTLT